MTRTKGRAGGKKPPIDYWSHTSLMAFLRNPLAWYKRYVEKIYDTPSSPAGIVGRAAHVALQHFYEGASKEESVELGLEYLRDVPDFEINFGVNRTHAAQKKKRAAMEKEYKQAVGFYLRRAPRYEVLGVEEKGYAYVEGLPLPIKAISDLVVVSKGNPGCVDIVDHKFVASFTPKGGYKTQFILQAIFNYYTVKATFNMDVKRCIFNECKKTRNTNGASQMRRHVIHFDECREEFRIFHKLLNEATEEITRRRIYLPNPGDMFEGEDSMDMYRLGLIE
ncbi:hypothetical protein CL652_01995 [bacterium]|nr:hypothetical protein [bacterium]|tara:strand:+ start:2119 stop:2955 length:837 start_codon:yes stop_codon:yes gene_type:complete